MAPRVFMLTGGDTDARRHRTMRLLHSRGLPAVHEMPGFSLTRFEDPGTLTARARSILRGPVCATQLEATVACLKGNVSFCRDACLKRWWTTNPLDPADRDWKPPGSPCEHTNAYEGFISKRSVRACSTVPGQALSVMHMLFRIQWMYKSGQLNSLVLLVENDVEPQEGWIPGYQHFLAHHPPPMWHLAKLHGNSTGVLDTGEPCQRRFGTVAMLMHSRNAGLILRQLESLPVGNIDVMLDVLSTRGSLTMLSSDDVLFFAADSRHDTVASTHEEVGVPTPVAVDDEAWRASKRRFELHMDKVEGFRPHRMVCHIPRELQIVRARARAYCSEHASTGRRCLQPVLPSSAVCDARCRVARRSRRPVDARVVTTLTSLLRVPARFERRQTRIRLPDGVQPGAWQSMGRAERAPNAPAYYTLTELGSGHGEYGEALTRIDQRFRYEGFDPAGNVEEVTGGRVRFADISHAAVLTASHWVLALDVGDREHSSP